MQTRSAMRQAVASASSSSNHADNRTIAGLNTATDATSGADVSYHPTRLITPKSMSSQGEGTSQPRDSRRIVRIKLTSGLIQKLQQLPLSPAAEVNSTSVQHKVLDSDATDNGDVSQDKQAGVDTAYEHTKTLEIPNQIERNSIEKLPHDSTKGDWEVLPHNLGRIWRPAVTVGAATTNIDTRSHDEDPTSSGHADETRTQQVQLRYGVRSQRTISSTTTELEQNQQKDADIDVQKTDGTRALKRKRHGRKASGDDKSEENADKKITNKKPGRKARRTKENPYGLTPGETPYSDWSAPSAEQCQEVHDILAIIHGKVSILPPQDIPAPSLEVAGCGEVPSILDGLIRTVLSGSTTFESADKMLQKLVERFGVLESGIGKGSVDWNNVRLAEYDDVYEQLKNGGLGKIKAKHIQGILSMVHDENMSRRAAYLEEAETGVQADVAGAVNNTDGQRKLEIMKADQEMLSLDHLHGLSTDEVMKHFVRYPGVGVKTAACVTLFCLQRPCFAVDTHVFRMSKWLGWVPQKTNEDDTFSHLETFMGTEAWEKSECPLEHLLNRFNKRAAKLKGATKQEKDLVKNEEEQDDTQQQGQLSTLVMGKNAQLTENADNTGMDGYDSEESSVLSELDEADMDIEMFETMYARD
ncbi:hypothetical protein G7054_g7757 [Neopestalotiopsis clavispora]|nr:hypothetical protein G7054_g7757 [Neopestalotiopsis clavispora]